MLLQLVHLYVPGGIFHSPSLAPSVSGLPSISTFIVTAPMDRYQVEFQSFAPSIQPGQP